jgi:hypothetical protein
MGVERSRAEAVYDAGWDVAGEVLLRRDCEILRLIRRVEQVERGPGAQGQGSQVEEARERSHGGRAGHKGHDGNPLALAARGSARLWR